MPNPPGPTPQNSGLGTVWIIVIVVVVALLLGFLGFLLYRYKMATVGKGTAVVYSADGKPINQSAATGEIAEDERQLLDI